MTETSLFLLLWRRFLRRSNLRRLRRAPCPLENCQKIALAQSLFEKAQNRPYPRVIERSSSLMNHTTNVLDVFRASRQYLRDDEILRTDHGNEGAADIDGNCPLQKVFLQSRPREDHVERHARAAMNEWENARSRHEIGIVEEKLEAVLPHRL